MKNFSFLRQMALLIISLLFVVLNSAAASLANLPPNELGKIMILMYHKIGSPEAIWARSPENFRKDLKLLYSKGYYLINLNDLADGKINVPAGKTPYVLTFDDGAPGQFGKINTVHGEQWNPDSAVGIILKMHQTHPDFGMGGTFYLNKDSRQEKKWASWFQEMVDLGFELGNHTASHPQLKKLSKTRVTYEIADLQRWIQKLVPGYHVRSLALPFGIHAQDDSWVASGAIGDDIYQHDIVLEVGSGPASSPFSTKFQPLRLPRLRGSDSVIDKSSNPADPSPAFLDRALRYFDKNPEQRFVSDGDPLRITIPRPWRNLLRHDLPPGVHLEYLEGTGNQ